MGAGAAERNRAKAWKPAVLSRTVWNRHGAWRCSPYGGLSMENPLFPVITENLLDFALALKDGREYESIDLPREETMIHRSMTVLVVAAILSALLGACSDGWRHHRAWHGWDADRPAQGGGSAANSAGIPFNTVYDFSTDPSWDPAASGDYGTGLALTDINGDGYPDMVVSSGNDKALQCVQVFYNDGTGHFPTTPSWHSADRQHNGLLAVGDIDGNGYTDVAVSVFLGDESEYTGGGAKVYLNQGPPNFLETSPSWQVTGYPSFGLDLGDADGDGDLDLAVACGEPIPAEEVFATCSFGGADSRVKSRRASTVNPEPPFNCRQVIYRNGGGRLSTSPWWQSDDAFVAMACKFADVNQDGLMDLAFPSAPVRVYLGQINSTLATSPSWQSVDVNYYGNGIDFAATMHPTWSPEPDTVPTLATSANNYIGNGRGGFSLYRFLDPYIIRYAPRTSLPDWQSAQGGWGSAVLLADIDLDGNLDLLTHRWNDPGRNDLDGTLLVYTGNDATLSATPIWQTESVSVIEHICLSDLDRGQTEKVDWDFTLTQIWAENHWGPNQGCSRVVSLPMQNPAAILAVTRGGSKLSPIKDYSVVPGGNYVSFNDPLVVGETVTITYEGSAYPDMAYTNWNCEKGNYVYYNTRAN